MMAKRMGYRGSDPTALKAIGRVYRQEEWKRRQEVLKELERGSRHGRNMGQRDAGAVKNHHCRSMVRGNSFSVELEES